jgi:hypothetical protein
VDLETLTELEREVAELRANLKRLRRWGRDTSADEALLVQLELLLVTIRVEKSGRDPQGP